jgi:hypothetical protein
MLTSQVSCLLRRWAGDWTVTGQGVKRTSTGSRANWTVNGSLCFASGSAVGFLPTTGCMLYDRPMTLHTASVAHNKVDGRSRSISLPQCIGSPRQTATVEILALSGMFASARSRPPTDPPPTADSRDSDDSNSNPCLARALAPQVCDTTRAASGPSGPGPESPDSAGAGPHCRAELRIMKFTKTRVSESPPAGWAGVKGRRKVAPRIFAAPGVAKMYQAQTAQW